jgi:hypothetical protein
MGSILVKHVTKGFNELMLKPIPKKIPWYSMDIAGGKTKKYGVFQKWNTHCMNYIFENLMNVQFFKTPHIHEQKIH